MRHIVIVQCLLSASVFRSATTELITTVNSTNAGGAGVQVPLTWLPNTPLATVQLMVGTPPQRVFAQVDSASEVLWLPEATSRASYGQAFLHNQSSSGMLGAEANLGAYADGTKVAGHSFRDVVRIGNVETPKAPFLLADSATGVAAKSYGIFGLGHRCKDHDIGDGPHVDGFFCHFWRKHPSMPETVRLKLGGQKPYMHLGEDLREGRRDQNGVRFLKDTFSSQTSLWYAPLSAMGFSWANKSAKTTPWAIDFTTFNKQGGAALLDSGAGAIRVSSAIFEMILQQLANGCQRAVGAGIVCPCNEVSDFPSLAFNFETSGSNRFLGVDASPGVTSCVPPEAYVGKVMATLGQRQTCRLAILDAGPYSMVFDTEAIVLGVPFFRGVEVAYDNAKKKVAIGQSSESTAGLAMFQCTDPKLAAAAQASRFNWLHMAAIAMFCCAVTSLIFLWGSVSPGTEDTSQAHLAAEACSSPQGAGSHMSRLLREA